MAAEPRINIAIAGGPCTGKSTLAAYLFAGLKSRGFDYDLIAEECRKLKKEFGDFRSPFERFYMWRQQEREELRSTASNGFITDKPLFHYYVQARQFAQEPRDKLAVRELFRMCMDLEDRYQLIVIARNPAELPYCKDQSRRGSEEMARARHRLVRSFVEHFWPEKLHFVEGTLDQRVEQVMKKLGEMRQGTGHVPMLAKGIP
jgi:nicotinamide riboside kinase